MTRTRLFLASRSQALRLPKDVAFPSGVTDVTIVKDGSRRIVVPAGSVWDDFFDAPGIDIGERDQPAWEEREAWSCFAIRPAGGEPAGRRPLRRTAGGSALRSRCRRHPDGFGAAGSGHRAYDLLIAGHARSRGMILVTGNLGAFSRVPGRRSEDWLSAP